MLSKKTIFLLCSLSLVFLLFLLYNVTHHTIITQTDIWVNHYITLLYKPHLTTFIIGLTHLGGIFANTLFAMFMLLFLGYKKWYKERLFYFFSYLGSVILYLGLKQIVERNRPDTALIDVINYSFPSGHATLTMTTVLLLYLIFIKKSPRLRLHQILLFLGMLWVVTIAFTRVYLHVHWLSDVLAGVSLGIFWITFMYYIFYWRIR